MDVAAKARNREWGTSKGNGRMKIGNKMKLLIGLGFKLDFVSNLPPQPRVFWYANVAFTIFALNGLETKISRTFLDFLQLGHEFFVISGHGT